MFHQTIHDILALTAAAARPEDILDCLRTRILGFEPFECGEIVAHSDRGPVRFAFGAESEDLTEAFLKELGHEPTRRLDTAAEIRERGLLARKDLSSLLILRLELETYDRAALVLGHSRAWSFAAAPLFRLRTLGNIALRLIAPAADPARTGEVAALEAEQVRLRARIVSLEKEILGLQGGKATPPSGRPR